MSFKTMFKDKIIQEGKRVFVTESNTFVEVLKVTDSEVLCIDENKKHRKFHLNGISILNNNILDNIDFFESHLL